MKTVFLYKIRHAGSNVDSYSCDPVLVEEMVRSGDIVSCKRFKVVV